MSSFLPRLGGRQNRVLCNEMLCFCHFMIFLDGRRQHGQWQKHQKQCFCLIPSIRIPDWKSLSLLPYLAFTALYISELNFICSASLGPTNFNVWSLRVMLVNNKIPPLPPHLSTFKLRVLQIFAATSQSDGHSSVIFILIIKRYLISCEDPARLLTNQRKLLSTIGQSEPRDSWDNLCPESTLGRQLSR